jgi:organic radical activating enzyme
MIPIKQAGFPEYTMLHFDWFFTDWCNYSCSYCSAAEKMVESFNKKTSPARYKLALTKLKLVKSPFKIELLGGEPTLHPNIYEVLHELSAMEMCKEIEIITNLSRSKHWFKKLNSPEYNRIRILASYHPEYFSQQFIDKAVAITAMEHLEFMVNINLSDREADWPNTIELIRQFDDAGVKYGFNFLSPTPDYKPNYSPEFFKAMGPYIKGKFAEGFPYTFEDGTTATYGESDIIVNTHLRSFTGYKCKALMYSILIDGEIVNACTRRRVAMNMPIDELIMYDTCCQSICFCDIMYNFHKVKQ